MFKVRIEVPMFQRLRMDKDTLEAKAANKAALLIRKRLKAGQDADGALPKNKKDGSPLLKDTGELIKSVKQRKGKRVSGRIVRATGTHTSNGQRNAAILGIQIATHPGMDPMGTDENIDKAIRETLSKEMAKQVASGKMGLVAELKRVT